MNELEYLEPRLRDWTPRRPSPKLKQRIFGMPEEIEAPFIFGDLWRWLVPVMGCFVLVVGSISPRSSHSAYLGSFTNSLLAQSNGYTAQPLMANLPEHSEQNNVPATKVEWSFSGRSTAVVQSIQFYTNNLIQ